jgi:hypothetical protein
MQSLEVYERYMKYLTGCARLFHDGYIDVNQFTLTKQLCGVERAETTCQLDGRSNVGGRVSRGYRYLG